MQRSWQERGHKGAKRTKAEALVNNFGAIGLKIAALDLQEFSTADRDMILASLASLQNTLNEAFDRMAQRGNVPV